MSDTKELDFFVAERNWPKGLDWYRSRFPTDARKSLTGGTANPLYSKIERPVLSPQLREQIALRLADDVARLRAATGQRFEIWSL